MLAPYPNRLRSSRSTPAQNDANSPSASTSPPPPPPPPPSHAFPPSASTSTSQHRLFSSRSSLPLTRMRTNSLSSSSLTQSDVPSLSTGHAPPRPQRNPTRRPILPSRPSTSSGIPDKKQSQVPIVISSPFVGVAPVPHFADFMPSRRRSTKRPSSRKESVPPTHSNGSGFTSVDPAMNDPRFSTPDRAILEELKLGAAARASQFKIIGNKKHHSYPVNEAPYPCNYERPVIDHDVWETGFIRQLCASQTFHVFETPPTKVLDLGCGSGYWILECAKIWRNCEFVGLDLVHLHPDLSHLRSSDLGSRIKWVPANCLEGLPFPNEEFDFVHVKRIAHGIPEDKWDFLLEEISRVMKPGGAIEMIEEDLFFPGQSPDSPPLSRSPTPIPHLSTSPTSSIPLPNGQHYSTNDQRSPSQFGSTATITAPTSDPRIYPPSLRSAIGTTSMLTLSTSIRNTDTIILPGSSDNLYFDNARPPSSITMNPRDHSLLEYIYTEMHAARFINLSPLSLLANSLPLYFNNVRSHAPIMFMFPPLDLAGVTKQLSRSPDDRGASDRRPAQRYHEDSGKTSSVTLIGSRQILNHTQQYVVLDESAVAPGTITARQKASSSALHLPCAASNLGTPMQNNSASPSAPVSSESLSTEVHSTSTSPVAHPQAAGDDKDPASRLNTLPNQRLRFDLQSLNMHLSTRVTEILACAEAMWEWVCKYQDAHRSHGGQQPHVHKEHSQPRNVRPGERDDASRFGAELIGMSRAEFDVLLTRLELDMRDCVNIESRITSAFHTPAPSLELTNDRKAFDNACEKWEEYQIKQRERYRTRSVGISPKEGADPSIAGSSEFDDGEAAGSARLRLSRTIRVFCAWKAS